MNLFYSLSIIFAIIFIGFFCGKKKILNETHLEGFELFLFKVGIPSYLFSATITNDISNLINYKFLGSYIVTFLIVAGSTFLFFWNKNKSIANNLIKAMASGYVNAAIYALPVITFLLGNPDSAILGNLTQIIILQTSFMTILNFIRHKDQSILYRIISVFKNPIVVLPLAGIILHNYDIKADFLTAVTTDLGNGAAGLALFTFGLVLSTIKLEAEHLTKDLWFIVGMKNIAHPVVAILVGYYLFNLDQYWLYSLIISASAPTAFLVYFTASQFAIEARFIKLIVSLTSILSLVSLIIIILAFRFLSTGI